MSQTTHFREGAVLLTLTRGRQLMTAALMATGLVPCILHPHTYLGPRGLPDWTGRLQGQVARPLMLPCCLALLSIRTYPADYWAGR